MPYSIAQQDNQYCVVNDDSGETVGCHNTEQDAQDQITALNIAKDEDIEEADTYTPPEAVQNAAARGLRWRDEYGRGGTAVGVARARDLSNGSSVSAETIGRMKSFFARHGSNRSEHYDLKDGEPTTWRIAWELWGGDAGRSWVEGINLDDEADEADKPVQEAALTETVALSEAPANGRATIRLIQPGWGSSGYYPAEVLQRDGPNVFRAGTQMYLDHPTREEDAGRPERSVRDLAGKLTGDAFWAGDGLYAEAEIYPHHREVLSALADDIGVSIRANGTATRGEMDGRKGSIIERITDAASVDYVTKAGAGGRVMALLEAQRTNTKPEQESDMSETADVQALTRRLEEAEARLTKQTELLEAYDQTKKELVEALNRERRERQMSEARQFIADRIDEYNFRERTANRLNRELAAQVAFTEAGSVDYDALRTLISETAKATQQELMEANPTGLITGMGSTGAPLQESVEDFQQRQVKAFMTLGMSESAAKLAAGGQL